MLCYDLNHDSVAAIGWCISTLGAAIAARVAVRYLFPTETGGRLIGHVFVVCWGALAISSFALSIVHSLSATALLGSVVILCVAFARLVKPGAIVVGGQPRATEISTTDVSPVGATSESSLWIWLWASLLAVCAARSIHDGLLRFPTEWDDLMYHLPLVDCYIQTGSLCVPTSPRWSDPGNNELIALWVAISFSGDFLYALTNIPAAVLLAWAALEIGRQLGIGSAVRHLAVVTIVMNYVVLKQLTTVGNDVAVAALFFTTLAYALRYSNANRRADLALGCIALGLLSGIKYYALGYAAVAVVSAVWLISRRLGWRAVWHASIAGAAGAFLFGGYWYLRNWLVGGSPLFPLGRTPSPDEIEGFYPALWQSTFAGNGRPELLPLAATAIQSLCGPFALIAVPAVPLTTAWLTVVGGPHPSTATRSARRFLVLATVGAAAVSAVTPFAVEDAPGTLNQLHWKYCPVRYTSCFISLALLCLATVLSDAAHGVVSFALNAISRLSQRHEGDPAFACRPPATEKISSGLAAIVLVGMLAIHARDQIHFIDVITVDFVLIAANIFLVGWLVMVIVKEYCMSVAFGLCLALALVVSFSVYHLSLRWHQGFVPYYDRMLGAGTFGFVTREIPPGAAICVLDLRSYPFFGSARQFRVVQPAVMRKTYEGFKDYLREQNCYAVVARFNIEVDWRGWLAVRPWIVEHPDLFRQTGSSQWPHLVYFIGGDHVPVANRCADPRIERS